jgi:Sec-independent protein translocase protein TatA
MVLLVVALIVIGPERMPELARGLARLLRDLRGAMDEVRGHFDDLTREDLFDTKEIDSYYRETIDSVKKVVEMPTEIKKDLSGAQDEVKGVSQEVQEIKEDFESEFEGSLKYLGGPIDEESQEESQEKAKEDLKEDLKEEAKTSGPQPWEPQLPEPGDAEPEDDKTGQSEPDDSSDESSVEPPGQPS